MASKTGQRHVQGRTKAGGQSQQRFARRRDNQARQAYEAAAGHAVRLLTEPSVLAGPLVTGGDHAAIEAVLEDPRLRGLAVDPRWLALPDPRRSVLEQGVSEALCASVVVRQRLGPRMTRARRPELVDRCVLRQFAALDGLDLTWSRR